MAWINFGDFALDPVNELLHRGSTKIPLRPKAFALLSYLALRPGCLVTKNQLIDALWPDCNVEEDALKRCMEDVRKALGDDARHPRFIETVHRRGYRFIGTTAGSGPLPGMEGTSVGRQDPGDSSLWSPLVERESEIGRLQECFQKAMRGNRQVVFVTGEQGIGKTSLVDAFLNSVDLAAKTGASSASDSVDFWVGRGQCIHAHGPGEAYMPVLEILHRLSRELPGCLLQEILRKHAPLWLLQIPSLVNASRRRSMQMTAVGATPQRMLREMADAMEVLTAERLLILVLEDLHWSDPSTLELIACLAKRRQPSKLLLIATFRTNGASDGNPSLDVLKDELEMHQQCLSLTLPPLSPTAIGEYLKRRFPDHHFPPGMELWMHRQSGGNPLFMINILNHWMQQGMIVQDEGWRLRVELEKAGLEVPPVIQRVIERQLEQCSDIEARVLKAGSVEGIEFSVNCVAAALGQKLDRIRAACDRLARRQRFLEPAGCRSLSGGLRMTCFRFIHAMYQSVCYQLLTEDQRMRMHRAIGRYSERVYGKQSEDMAAKMAMHFDQGGDAGRAIQHYQKAADIANSRFAGREALALAMRGMELLERIPAGHRRRYHEMKLQIAYGTALMFTRGAGVKDVQLAFNRAWKLYRSVIKVRGCGDNRQFFSALYALWDYHWARADYGATRELAEQLLELARVESDPAMPPLAHHAMGMALMDHGEFVGALRHLKKSPRVVGRCCASLALWRLGFPDRALESLQAATAYARETGTPENCIFSHLGAAQVLMARGEIEKALENAKSALDLALQHELVEERIAPMRCIWGWALAKLGQRETGLEQMRRALAAQSGLGFTSFYPCMLGMLAEILNECGRTDEALAAVEDALTASRKTGICHYDSELYRLKGEILSNGVLHSLSSNGKVMRLQEARSSFLRAVEIARRQRAKSFELRAITSLARLLRAQNRKAEARRRLSGISAWFTEGHDTADQREARNLLLELS